MALSYLQQTGDGTNLTTYTFSAQNLGTATADRFIHVAIQGRASDGTARTINTVTIGGVTATINAQISANGDQVGVATAAVPTGATGDIVVIWSTTMGNCDIAAYRSTGLASATASDTLTSSATPPSGGLDIPANGFAIAISMNRDGLASCSWVGVTEDYDITDTGGNDTSGASGELAEELNRTITATWVTQSLPKMAAASFAGPSTTLIKTINGLAKTSVKTVNSLAIGSVKTVGGLA